MYGAAVRLLAVVGLVSVFGARPGHAAGLLTPVNAPQTTVKMHTHRVDVTINNGFARTEVDQIFINSGSENVEAIYSFPIPEKASLSELSLWIDGKETIGEVVPKRKARELYDDQKAQGNHTALAEQDSFKTFDVRVYPVLAGQDTRVRLVYYQPIDIDLNVGRYVYPLAEGGVDEERIAFWSTDEEVTGEFSFSLTVKSAFPVKDIRLPNSPQAPVTRTQSGDGEVITATIVHEGSTTLSKDIVVYYRLDPSVPARVELVPYKRPGERRGTFMAVVTPGASLASIKKGTDWTFVLDKSGSMSGGKIASLCDGVAKAIRRLRPQDRFRVIVFDDQAADITGGFNGVSPDAVESALRTVAAVEAGGGTDMHAGLSMGLKGLDADRTQGIILVTDGVANQGLIEHAEFMKLLAAHDVRLFTFIIGNSANTPLLEDLARESNGFAMRISDSDDIVGRVLQAQAKVVTQSMRDVSLRIDGVKVSEMTPSQLPSLYAGKQLVVFGTYDGGGEASLRFTATIEGKEQQWSCAAVLPDTATANPEIERLWAYARIEELMAGIRRNGETDDSRGQVVDIATRYSLVTPYTSMLVLNDEERERLGLSRHNAERVQRERAAQQYRGTQPVQNNRVDRGNRSMFRGAPSFDLGTGPVGPLFVLLSGLLGWRRKRTTKHGDT